ncbi:MAG TPA: hypothetical protein VHC69_12620 [Polyangiaceae bacterium]|nr:hypothetical protein [Polyangiaceae bacterium]
MTALRLSGASFLLAIGLAALPTTGCGGDSGGGGGSGGGSGKSGSGGKSSSDAGPSSGGSTSTGAAPSTGGAPAGSIPCGSTNCTAPDGMTACCRDMFQGLCGVEATGIMTGCVEPPKPPPPGCPALPSVMGFMTTACCTSMGQCGVDESAFGQGCVDIATAAAQAMQMGINVGQVPAEASCTPGDGGT